VRRLDPVYRSMCPNCGGSISASRLSLGLPCASCYPREAPADVEEVAEELRARGRLLGYYWLYDLERRFRDFSAFFEARTGSSLWSAQRSWARRLLAMDSLAIIAPTGVGKSTLLQVYSAYRVIRDSWRVLYLVPTENLARQVASRLEALLPGRVVYYYSSMPKRAREEALARIESGDYSVLVVTTGFLQRRFELLRGAAPFNLIVVDDVDSLLRNSRNIDRVVVLLGYPEEAVEAAEKLIRARLKLLRLLAAGKRESAGEVEQEIAAYEAELRALIPEEPGQLVIASATGRPRGIKHLIFRELLGFEVGGGTDYMRDVTDAYVVSGDPLGEVVRLVERLGPGGIVFVSQLHGKAAARLVKEALEAAGVRAGLALAGGRRAVDKLARGELDVLVGVASRYGVLVRGLDLPERVRYAVFLGVPARRMKFSDAVASPRRLLLLLYHLADEGDEEASRLAEKLRRLVDRVPDPSIVAAAYKGRIRAEGLLAELVEEMRGAAAYAEARFASKASRGPVRVGGIVVEEEGGELWVVSPDAPTYLQASGRTSRLYRGVMTRGISIVVDSNAERVEALAERLSFYTSSRFRPLSEVDLEAELKAVEESRRGVGKRVTVKTVLLVVESPTKARTIAWFWGRPSRRRSGRLVIYETSALDPETGTVYLLTITSTRGHLFDLTIDDVGVYGVVMGDGRVEPVYDNVRRCLDCGYQYAGKGPCPRCGSTRLLDSSSVVATLRKLATEVDEIVVATDPDREGEKIAWDIYLALRPYNERIRRGRFHEVTRHAILEALRGAGGFDERLVNAQIVRRVEDRWIGFTLSKHLWAVYGKRWLGAGRVQTPVLGWIIERYGEWKANRGYALIVELEGGGRLRVFSRERGVLEEARAAGHLVVEEVEYWEEDSSPPPPFTTDSLIYEASRRYGFSAGLTMRLAQDLFESGLITYHRTDSTRVSPAGMAIAREYLEKRGLGGLYRGRPWGEGGAHEAIRPTRPVDVGELEKAVYSGAIRVPVKLTRLHLKLYDLIFRRFIASQMVASRLRHARLAYRLGPVREETVLVVAAGPGYALVYPPLIAGWAADLAPGDRVAVVSARIVRASSVRLYTSGDVVRLMKERRIGRPSTYAKAIEANRRHGYIVESKKRSYLIPTRLGMEVYSYLSANFAEFVSEETSARLEELLERIEAGEVDPVEALEAIWVEISSAVPSAEAA